jgi:DNA-binding response OmpR family regulator
MRVLIVDDDQSILRMVEFALQKLGPDCQIFTAGNMDTALEHIEHQSIDMMLTDYMMPGMTGVDLARIVQRISPTTQVVLMTAYGTDKLRDTSTHIGFDAYLDKPFDMDELRSLIKSKMAEILSGQEQDPDRTVVSPAPEGTAEPEDVKPQTISTLLDSLLTNAGARAVLLLKTNGEPLKLAGQIESGRATSLAALVAANFLNTTELSTLIDNKKMFKSGFYEGESYNMYVCGVDLESLLAVIFDAKLRPGVVWFYTRQVAGELASLLG